MINIEGRSKADQSNTLLWKEAKEILDIHGRLESGKDNEFLVATPDVTFPNEHNGSGMDFLYLRGHHTENGLLDLTLEHTTIGTYGVFNMGIVLQAGEEYSLKQSERIRARMAIIRATLNESDETKFDPSLERVRVRKDHKATTIKHLRKLS